MMKRLMRVQYSSNNWQQYESSQRSTCLKSCAFEQEQKQRNGGGEKLSKSTGCDKNGNNEHLKAHSLKGGE